MQVLKVRFILKKPDGSDIDQDYVSKYCDEFIEFVEKHNLDWYGHFSIVGGRGE